MQALSVPPVGDGSHRAVGRHSSDAAVVGALAHDQAALPVEGTAVTLAGAFPDHTDAAGFIPAEQTAAGQVDEGEVTAGVPQWAFGIAQTFCQ